jgi:N-carbamoyl-L-amino-acid hydrolase
LLPLASAQVVEDMYGISVATALSGHSGSLPLGRALDAYFELHIEQGPILEQAGLDIGVVTGSQAICWLDATLEGQAAHAGTTPMALRKDALFAAAAMVCQLERLAADFQPGGLVTVGQQIARAARNSVPGQLSFSIDLRHPDEDSMHACAAIAATACMPLPGRAVSGLPCASAGTARRCILMTAAWRHCARLAVGLPPAGHGERCRSRCHSSGCAMPQRHAVHSLPPGHQPSRSGKCQPGGGQQGGQCLLHAVLQRSNRD